MGADIKKLLPIGIDSFREIRETDRYYVDKSLIIQDFIRYGDKVALITRPRRFGKTLNMTTIREFFDITKDSKDIFEGLAIMDTEHASQINSRPVLYFTFKDCKAKTIDTLMFQIANVVLKEYAKYEKIFNDKADMSNLHYRTCSMIYEKLSSRSMDINEELLAISIEELIQAVYEYYKVKPIVLIDEYDQPILSCVEHGYYEELKTFFPWFYGGALKGQDCLYQALLTGIQRIAKESIFSQLNNIRVYAVTDEPYSGYFGLTTEEMEVLLPDYGLVLNEQVKQKYDGYIFGKTEMYNPWSALNYADTGLLENYWLNTSTNFLIRKSVAEAGRMFQKGFDRLIADGIAEVGAELACSFFELKHSDTLWGLLINSGYMTIVEKEVGSPFAKVRIPNGEVRSEFSKIIADSANVDNMDLHKMFQYLLRKDMEGFIDIYRELVLSCTSYHDARENAYHMLFLGMCISLKGLYKITSNAEAGHGRSDIRMESLSAERPHIIIEFKQGDDVDTLAKKALRQISEKRYYEGLSGECLLLGIAHDKKKCTAAHKTISASLSYE